MGAALSVLAGAGPLEQVVCSAAMCFEEGTAACAYGPRLAACCGPDPPPNCWTVQVHDASGRSRLLEREQCCPEPDEEKGAVLDADASDTLDEACASAWLSAYKLYGALSARFRNVTCRAPTRTVPSFRWDGVAVHGPPEGFYAFDATGCVHPPSDSSIHGSDDSEKDPCSASQMFAKRIAQGRTWQPPPTSTACVLYLLDCSELDCAEFLALPRPWDRADSQLPPVYMLTLDSVSRNSLRYLLPKTYEWLNARASAPVSPQATSSHRPADEQSQHSGSPLPHRPAWRDAAADDPGALWRDARNGISYSGRYLL